MFMLAHEWTLLILCGPIGLSEAAHTPQVLHLQMSPDTRNEEDLINHYM